MSFKELKLTPPILQKIEKVGLKEATPIQSLVIPHVLKGQDLIACAQTGTGKTFAFLLPIAQHLLEKPNSKALIMAPTRELASQIFEEARKLDLLSDGIFMGLFVGGMSYFPQYRAIEKGARLLVATPGRINDHLDKKSLSLESFDVLVLDEADRMLDMGFAPQIRKIVKEIPGMRQTLCFTATITPDLEKLSKSFLIKPVKLSTESAEKPIANIKQDIIFVSQDKKLQTLEDELIKRKGSIIIFTRTQKRTEKVAWELKEMGHEVAFIHGSCSHAERKRAIKRFREGDRRILVATDIAARGLDIPHVSHVINFDLPEQIEDFVHRIGRTARAGRDGRALTLVSPQEKAAWKEILKFQKL